MFQPSKYRCTIARRRWRHPASGHTADSAAWRHRERVGRQDSLDRLVADPAVVAPPADCGDLMGTEGRVLGFEVSGCAAGYRRAACAGPGIAARRGPSNRLAIPSASKRSALRSSVRSEIPVVARHAAAAVCPNRTIGAATRSLLLRPGHIEADLVNLVRWLAARTFWRRHCSSRCV